MKTNFQYIIILLINVILSFSTLADTDEPAEGQIAPDFQITQLNGNRFQLSDFRGKKPVYLVFWNTWCTYCMKKIPKLKEAQINLTDDIQIIAVNTSLKDSVKKSFKFQKQFDINYPLAFDHDKKVTDLYGVWGTPTEFIIDINGIIQHRDGVPENLSNHLVKWNQLINVTQIANNTAKDCNHQEKQTC